MVVKNQSVQLEIIDINHQGDGVAKHLGMAIFVPMTAPGDVIKAKIVKLQKTHAFAIIEEIITPSKNRIENDCKVYKRCGGCSLRQLDYPAEMAIKERLLLENMSRIGGINITPDPSLPSPESSRYRNKAQYPVRKVEGEIVTGFFSKRSHNIVPIDDCLLQPEFFSEITKAVVSFMSDYNIPAYDEEGHKGIVRHIYIRYAKATDQTMVAVVINSKILKNSDMLVNYIKEASSKVTTILLNHNTQKTNVVMGKDQSVLMGDGYIEDIICGLKLRLGAQSFYQVNPDAAQILYKAALEYANPTKDDVLLDLYCGVGSIGLSMAEKAGQVIGVEINAQAVEDAIYNAKLNGIENAKFICADAFKASLKLKEEGITPTTVIIDPPRKGIDASLVSCIDSMNCKKVVYISCNSATLARDAKEFAQLGFVLKKVRAADFFPRTYHLEALALFEKE